jgi:hypothetical protein
MPPRSNRSAPASAETGTRVPGRRPVLVERCWSVSTASDQCRKWQGHPTAAGVKEVPGVQNDATGVPADGFAELDRLRKCSQRAEGDELECQLHPDGRENIRTRSELANYPFGSASDRSRRADRRPDRACDLSQRDRAVHARVLADCQHPQSPSRKARRDRTCRPDHPANARPDTRLSSRSPARQQRIRSWSPHIRAHP